MKCRCRYCREYDLNLLFDKFQDMATKKNGLDDLRKARVYIDELIRQEEWREDKDNR